MDKESPAVQSYVDGSYLHQHPEWFEADGPWKAEQVARMLSKNAITPRSIADVGCGTGAVLEHLSRSLAPDIDLVGFELSPQALDLVPESRRSRIRFVNGDPAEGADRFDLVLLMDVLEHVPDYLGFLGSLRPLAKRFIFHIPLDLSVQTVLRMTPILAARHSVGHLHYFTRETALETLKLAGYFVIDELFTPAGISISRRSAKTRIAAVPRLLAFKVNQRMAARVLGGFPLLVLAEPTEPVGA